MWAKNTNKGFTIVELLIVIVVIAILASITVVAYNGIQSRAYDSTIKSDLANFAKKIEITKADTGSYPSSLTALMGFSFSKNVYGQDFQLRNARYCVNLATDSYILLVNTRAGNYFKAQNSAISSTASTYGWGVCSQIGLVNTNPTQNGFDSDLVPQWAAWTN